MTDGASDVLAAADTAGPVARRSLWSRFSSKSPVILALLALVLGFLIGALVIIFSTNTVLDAWRGIFHSWGAPGHALKVTFDNVGAAYRAMFTGSVIDPPQFWHSLTTGKQWSDSLTPISETLTYATPLVIASIAVGIAFQTGVFNIGANGQAIMGGIAGAAVGSMVNMPAIVHIPLTMACGIVGGMVAGAIPGFLKAFTGAHEVIVTLMLNYVIAFFLVFVLLSTSFQLPGQSNDISRTMYSSAQLAPLFGTASGLRVSYGVFIAAAVVLFAWWFLDRSSLGFDFRITGNNPHAARASGINARRIVVLVFLISGGLAGLAGVVQVASTTHYVDGNFLIGSAGIGFTAITVALLGRNRPMGIVWGSLLFAALGVGGRNMQAATGIPLDLATIIQSVVVLFVATPVLVKEIFRLRSTSANAVHLATQGWSS
ncbi:MAG: ABC transporter permease [Acidimicrobiales bacterium]|jgi:simple sugar transport system permease protein